MNMVSYKKVMISILCASWIVLSFARNSTQQVPNRKTISGPVEVCGYGQYKDSVFQQRVNVNGKLDVIEVEFRKAISINGSVLAKNSIFFETVDVNGSMEAAGSHFENTITFDGKLSLENSSAKEIIVANHNKKNQSTLILKGATVVVGDIIFEGEPGTVEIRKGAKILGSVKNGKIVTKR
ncbi:hypothetical protein HYX58_06190 [Candidatus Dependentiae bacterium]|nr:hypothetical protein [Candidatus Dependentiae bacterium]